MRTCAHTPMERAGMPPPSPRPAKHPAEAGGLWTFIVENIRNLFITWSALEMVLENMCNGLKVLVGTKDQPVYLTELTTSYWLRNVVLWLHLENTLEEVMWKKYLCPIDSPVASMSGSRGRHRRVLCATNRNFLDFIHFFKIFCKIVDLSVCPLVKGWRSLQGESWIRPCPVPFQCE